ncbi:HAD family hydrolase [Litoreibacter janthinus]|uniref:Haloacid dehalogenase superfamily, subfamily IA, variant 3 with third motif having DD or ED n=1 Tax=Litoreibacter janthinus TaxID=670154 RepID=A0A1I6GK02_9RHOB|nr:HAD family phosphatase [Litoreibacter janthinus]SFR42523.1 haloacid dehalogenase superfamily, subfamily IA, variant 3 with third motif having DD or ED [Litoreibacter janthinus]
MTSPPAAVVFDLDGCLVDSEPLVIAAIVEELQVENLNRLTFNDIRAGFLGMAMPVIWDSAAQGTGRAMPDDFVTRVEARLFTTFPAQLGCIDGVPQMLAKLSDNGVAVAIATGGSLRRMGEALRVCDLADTFKDVGFSADQVARGKPAPDLFEFAARNLGVDPKDCVVMEDSPHGVEGAVAAGMRVVGFVGGSHLHGMRDTHAQLLASKGAADVLTDIESVTAALLAHG